MTRAAPHTAAGSVITQGVFTRAADRRGLTVDPNEALQQMREAIESVWAAESSVQAAAAAESLAEYAGALDLWLSRGGFLPTAWSKR